MAADLIDIAGGGESITGPGGATRRGPVFVGAVVGHDRAIRGARVVGGNGRAGWPGRAGSIGVDSLGRARPFSPRW
ncbi:hypothetical protein B4N89_32140 [Embleya scabrispora]|uniref:Uncharacterized protein n=1 Tax=Embleya scabrispora TaxID=159449 RepID=A0A1T3NPX3_9ACTN|nr:hypothetical protein B4N89_32140 [Embleya scabrispora]